MPGATVRAFNTPYTEHSHGFVVKERDRREFLPGEARALGLDPGPEYGKLQNGESAETDDGTTVDPDDVLSDPQPGRKLLYTSDPVVTVDAEQRVSDANPAARELSAVAPGRENTTVASFFEPFPDLVEQPHTVGHKQGHRLVVCSARNKPVTAYVRRACPRTCVRQYQAGREETVTITHRGRQRDFDLTVSEAGSRQGSMLARVAVLREVTRLKQHERELELLSQLQSRVLGHNIRNELDVIRAQSERLAAELDEERAQLAEATISSVDRLLSVSSKTRVVERLVDHDQSPSTVDLAATVRQSLETRRETYPDVAFSVESPSSCPVETLPLMELALDILAENAAAHNTATEPMVTVVLTGTDDEVVVRIADNSPGIPEQELAVRDQGEEAPLEHGRGVILSDTSTWTRATDIRRHRPVPGRTDHRTVASFVSDSIRLWVVDWVIESSRASLTFDTDTGGTTATTRLPRPE